MTNNKINQIFFITTVVNTPSKKNPCFLAGILVISSVEISVGFLMGFSEVLYNYIQFYI